MTVTNHMHNPAIKVASNDALFVRPDHRGITAGRLIIAAEREAARRGATRILWHTRAGTNLADAFTKRGYKPADIVVMKEI
jgi:GNAT superfamily N-acetyltransferase